MCLIDMMAHMALAKNLRSVDCDTDRRPNLQVSRDVLVKVSYMFAKSFILVGNS